MNKDLVFVGDKTRPNVHFNYERGELTLEGRCILEYAEIIFNPIMDWLEKYIENPKEKTSINIALEYFNSSTAKALVRFLFLAKQLVDNNVQLEVNYYYDDETVREYGQDFVEVVGIPFNFTEKNFHK